MINEVVRREAAGVGLSPIFLTSRNIIVYCHNQGPHDRAELSHPGSVIKQPTVASSGALLEFGSQLTSKSNKISQQSRLDIK